MSGRRPGRPPASEAGEVDRRILDAATVVFLEHGFERTTFEEIAAHCGAGKASIYARYRSKEPLFVDVILRTVERILVLATPAPDDLSARERTRQVGIGIIEHTLTEEAIALLRLVIAEGARFPDLVRHTHGMARTACIATISAAIAPPGAAADDARVRGSANLFFDVVFMPFAMRALFGIELDVLKREMAAHVEACVTMLAAVGDVPGVDGKARSAGDVGATKAEEGFPP